MSTTPTSPNPAVLEEDKDEHFESKKIEDSDEQDVIIQHASTEVWPNFHSIPIEMLASKSTTLGYPTPLTPGPVATQPYGGPLDYWEDDSDDLDLEHKFEDVYEIGTQHCCVLECNKIATRLFENIDYCIPLCSSCFDTYECFK